MGVDGVGGSRRACGGRCWERSGGRDAGCRNSPCGSVVEGARSLAAQLSASCPLSGCAALPGGALCHGRPLPGGCVEALAEPCAVGVGAPRCCRRVQAPSHPRGCSWHVSHGCCSTRHRAGGRCSAKVDQRRVSLFSAPGLWLLPAAWIRPSWQCFSWFLFFHVPQRQTRAASLLHIFLVPSCCWDREPSRERGGPAWEAVFALPPHTCHALGCRFGILGQDCEIPVWAPILLHRVTVLRALHRA